MRPTRSLARLAVFALWAGGSAASPGGPVSVLATGLAPEAARAGRLLLPPHPLGTLTEESARPAEQVARTFVESVLAPPGELALVSIVSGAGGIRFVTLEQRFDDVPVAGGHVTVAITPSGAVRAARAGLLAHAAPVRSPVRALAGPEHARRRAAEIAGPVPEDAAVEPAWLATRDGAVLAYRVRTLPPDPRKARDLFLGAVDGRLVRAVPAGFGAVRARVYPHDPSRPSTLVTLADPQAAPTVDSPAGWSRDGATEGNNVEVHLEREAVLSTDGPRARAAGEPPALDFPFTGEPAADVDAALTNAFWALNFAHDRFRSLGFDEPSGALQEDNFGRGGADGDALHALVQYSSYDGTEPYPAVASAMGRDGTPSFIVAGVFRTPSGELRDAALETDLLVHEYAHAVVARSFAGEPLCLAGVQPSALVEGWGDFFAGSFTDDPVIGAWTADDPERGHRSAPMDSSRLTFVNFCGNGCDPFRDGEIWAATLWDLRETLVARHGEAGVAMAERLVLEGLRYAPCQPTFLGARDALLLAEAALHGGELHCDAWAAFAGRGLGAGASTTGPGDRFPQDDFGLPPQCEGGAALSFDHPEYPVSADAVLRLVDGTGAAAGTPVVVTSTSGDSESALLEAGPGPLFRATLTLEPGAPAPGDGVLQVADGDAIVAEHAASGAQAEALVDSELQLFLLSHRVGDSSCQGGGDDDHDAAPGWDLLPGFLDAGENADVTIRLAHVEPSPVEDVEVIVTSLDPRVSVHPAGPIPLGTIPAQDRGFGRLLEVVVHAAAQPSVQPGDVAVLRVSVTARGRAATVDVPLVLDMDYVLEEGLSPFRDGVETFESSSFSRLGWSHRANRPGGDDWRLAACAARGGDWGYGNVRADCVSYSEDQGAPSLVSPLLFRSLPPDTVAYRIADLGWSAHVDLYTDPGTPFCDADLVGVFATADPVGLPYDDPRGVFNYGPLRAYWFEDDDPEWQDSGPYQVDTAPQPFAPGAGLEQLRLAFVFWSEIFDVDDCGFETPNEGHFFVDDVRFSYDLVRAVPEATPCQATCLVHAELQAIPPGPKCDGEPFVLDASGSHVDGCSGEVRYRFEGPGLAGGAILETAIDAVFSDGAEYSVAVECRAVPDCASHRRIRPGSASDPGIGGPDPASLRVSRAGTDLDLTWRGAALPPTYGVFVATTRDEIEAGSRTWPLRLAVDGEGPRGEGAATLRGAASGPGLTALVVLPRDPCTDRPR